MISIYTVRTAHHMDGCGEPFVCIDRRITLYSGSGVGDLAMVAPTQARGVSNCHILYRGVHVWGVNALYAYLGHLHLWIRIISLLGLLVLA